MQQCKTSPYYSPIKSKTFQNNINDILCDIEFIKKGKSDYLGNVPCVFDIEASSFLINGEKQCTMYAWVLGINGKCIKGRTWEEFLEVIEKITKFYYLNIHKRIIIYIHNLSYEFQWIRKMFNWYKVFSIESRKPIYAITTSGIEFRCSYLLTGYSLEKLGENLIKYKVEKKVGDLDYNLKRHTKTILTEKEWGYILNDGLVVMAHIQEEIERLGNITKIPLTKTGYVRKLCEQKCLKSSDNFEYVRLMKTLKIQPDEYLQLKRTYTGGFTHANVNYVNKKINNVHSFDFSSSYPSVMLSEKYPMSKSFHVVIKDEKDFINKLNAYCCMFDCVFHNLQSISTYENYISISRCQKAEHYIINNGRVVEADIIKVSLTEQDFFIISKLYKWDYIEISNFKCYYKGYLPKQFIMAILELYKNKTTLKGIKGKEAEYMVSKNMLNSCYGMCVTDICRDENLYVNNSWEVQKPDINEMIEKYNKNNNRILFYPWGVWVTAYARKNLFSGICEFKDDYIYSDTDSIKVINIEKHIKYIENYNNSIKNKINMCLDYYNIPYNYAYPKNSKGEIKPMGVWEYEGKYNFFKTLGAKRYIVEKDGEIQITVAGVGKKAGANYLKYKYKNNNQIFNAFKEGLYFPPEYEINNKLENGSGKLCHTYIDTEMQGILIDYMGVENKYKELSGVHMENTDYTLSLDFEFKRLLKGINGGHIT